MEFDTQTQGEVMEVQSQSQPEEAPKTLYAQLVPREIKLKNLGIARYNYVFDVAQQDKVFGNSMCLWLLCFVIVNVPVFVMLFSCCDHELFSSSSRQQVSMKANTWWEDLRLRI
jgi:hypothetical protein